MLIESFWEQHHKKLKHYIAKKVSDAHEAEDILQEVSLKLIKYKEHLNSLDSAEAWLYRVTQNTIIDYYRSHARVESVSDFEALQLADISEDKSENFNEETASCMLKLADLLPETYKEAILESDYKGIKQTTLGKKWQLSNSGTKNRVQRARKKLKSILYECCDIRTDRSGNIIDLTNKNDNSEKFSCLDC